MAMEVRKIPKPQRPPRIPQEREAAAAEETWQPPTAFPTPPNGGGVVYKWVRKYLYGQLDQNNLSKRFREGWSQVPASEFPELMLLTDGTSEFLEVGGLVLCRASAEKMAQRKAYYERVTDRQMATVDQSMFRVEDKRMPMFRERSTTTTLGRRPAEDSATDGRL